jgi:hypothetical protein
MSVVSFVSLPTRFVASDWNATNRPFADRKGIAARVVSFGAGVREAHLTVLRRLRSRTNTSFVSFVSFAIRFSASESNAT